jgi:hypothetical protein
MSSGKYIWVEYKQSPLHYSTLLFSHTGERGQIFAASALQRVMEIQVWIHPVEGLDSNISSDNKKSTHTKQHVHEERTGMAAVGYGLQIWELWLWRTGRGAMAAAILKETPWSRGGLSFETSHTNLLLRSQHHRTYNYCTEVGWLSGVVTTTPIWSTFDNPQRPLGCHF